MKKNHGKENIRELFYQIKSNQSKNKNNGCLIAVCIISGLFLIYIVGLFLWSEYTESGKKYQLELKEEKRLTSKDFLQSDEPKTTNQKIDSAKLVRKWEDDNPELHLQNLRKELLNPKLKKVQKEEIEIEIKNLQSEKLSKKNINVWDNSSPKLEREVKKMLNDSKSFEHVETTYNYKKDKVVVTMKYRATNRLGAKVLDQATGTFDYDGNLIHLEN